MTMRHRIVQIFIAIAVLIGLSLSWRVFFADHKAPHSSPNHMMWASVLSRLSTEEKADLELYFRAMLLRSQGGYVLFGIKPICLESTADAYLRPNSNYVFQNMCGMMLKEARKGLQAWEKVPISKLSDNVIIVCYDRPDLPCKDSKHVLWIHRQAFLNVVNENLALFKSILGPRVTPQSLLDKLSDPKASFWSTLAHNKVLIGILLGFGTQNAFLQDRVERIDAALSQVERAPLAPRAVREDVDESGIPLSNLLTRFSIPLSEFEVRASFGFRNLSEEKKFLQQEMSGSRDLVSLASPAIPLFGCVKDSQETVRLLKEYADVQPKIKALLSSGNFLEQVLTLILGDRQVVRPQTSDQSLILPESADAALNRMKQKYPSSQLAFYVAQEIRKNLVSHDPEYVATFIAGMKEAESEGNGKPPLTDLERRKKMAPILECILPVRLDNARRNLQEGDEALGVIAETREVVEIVPARLYYKTATKGNGPPLTKDDLPTVRYTLSYLAGKKEGRLIACSPSVELDSAEVISGLAHGMLGMRLGETREIYIHSDFAYGCRSRFQAGVAMKARVELLSFRPPREKSQMTFPALVAVDQGIPEALAVPEDMELLAKQAAIAEGYIGWSFYRLANDLFSLGEVIDSLREVDVNESPQDYARGQAILDDLFIILYHRAFEKN